MRRIAVMTRSFLIGLLVAGAHLAGGHAADTAAAATAVSRPAAAAPRCIAVVGTNDLHGAIVPYVVSQYGVDVRSGGVIGLSAYIANLREQYGESMVLVDGGDMFQGTLASNMSHGRAVVDAYNILDYTAAAVGNHEFDYGPLADSNDRLSILKARIAQAKFPFLTLNIFDKATGKRVTWENSAPSIMREFGGIQVGILGISTPDTPRVTKLINVSTLDFKDPVPLIKQEAAALRQRGAQLVVMVGHVGGSCRNKNDPMDVASCQVAGDMELVNILNALPAKTVDVAVGGHTHQFMAHWINGTATIESGARGHYVGWVEACLAPGGGIDIATSTIHGATALCLDTWKDGGCSKRRLKVAPLPIAQAQFLGRPVVPSKPLQTAMQPYLDDVNAQSSKPIGVRLAKPLDSQALTVLAAEAMRRATHADFSAQNRGGIRTGLSAGDIVYGQIFEVMPFDNAVIRVSLTGAQVERLVKLMVGRRTHGGPTVLAGLKVERQNNKITVLTAKGRPLESQRRYTMALSDFIVQGGEGTEAIFKNVAEADKLDTQMSVLDTMIALLQKLHPAPADKKQSHELAPSP